MSARRAIKIRTTFIIVFMLFAAGIAAAGARYYFYLEKYLYATRMKELSAVAELKVRDVFSWRSERLADAQVLAMNPAVAEFIKGARSGSTASREKFTQWMDTFRDPYGYEGLLIVDPEGAELASVPRGRSLDPFVKTILSPSGKPAVFSEFYRGSDGKPSLAVCAPIRSSTNPAAPLLGYVVLYIDPARFLYPKIQNWPTPSATGETVLLGRDKDQVVYLNELLF